MKRQSNVIFSYRQSFRTGLMSLFSFGTDAHRFDSYLGGSNAADLRGDWVAVGNDMRSAFSQFEDKYTWKRIQKTKIDKK